MCTGILVRSYQIKPYIAVVSNYWMLTMHCYAISTLMENLILSFMHGQKDNEIQPALHYYKFCGVVEARAEIHR